MRPRHRRREDVAVRPALEVLVDAVGVGAEAGAERRGAEVGQDEAAVSRVLAVDREAHLVVVVRRPQELAARERAVAEVDVVAREVVGGVAVASFVGGRDARGEGVVGHRAGRADLVALGAVVADRAEQLGAGLPGRLLADQVDRAADGVAAPERAGRAAEDLDAVEPDQRQVGAAHAQLRDVVDERRHRRVALARADAPDVGEAEAPRGEAGDQRVGHEARRLFDRVDARVLEQLRGDRGDAARQVLQRRAARLLRRDDDPLRLLFAVLLFPLSARVLRGRRRGLCDHAADREAADGEVGAEQGPGWGRGGAEAARQSTQAAGEGQRHPRRRCRRLTSRLGACRSSALQPLTGCRSRTGVRRSRRSAAAAGTADPAPRPGCRTSRRPWPPRSAASR